VLRVKKQIQEKFDGHKSFDGRTNKLRKLCHLDNLEKVKIVHEVLVQLLK
jgi:hypothetical protein